MEDSRRRVDDPRSCGGAFPRAALAATALFLLLGTHQRVGGWNDASRLAMVEALVEHGRLAVDGTAMGRITGDVARIDGRFYSDKPPALALLAVPVYAVEARLGITFATARPRAYYWTTLLTVGLTTLLGLVALERFLRRIVADPRWRAATVAGIAFGTLNTSYSITFSNHPPAATALLAGTLLLWRWRRFGAGLASVAAGAALVGIAALTDHGAAFFAPALAAYLGWPGAPRRLPAVLVFATIVGVALAAYAAYAFALSGSPLPLSLQPRLFEYPGSYFAGSAHLAGSSLPHGTASALLAYAGLCLVGRRGLFSHTPTLLFVLLGMLRCALDRTYAWRAEVWAVLIPTCVLVAYYLVTSTDAGGNAYGVRWFCLFIPLAYVFLADAYGRLRSRHGRTLFWVAYAVSIPLALIGALDPWLDFSRYGTGFSWVLVLRSRGWL